MCRYAVVRYKPHYACFNCRKTFKRRLMWDISRDTKTVDVEAKCPQCSQLMANMGLDFAAPKKEDVKKWKHLQSLYSVGIAFHSCGCTGPGYIPNTTEELVAYFKEKLQCYNTELEFWRNRVEPTNEREIQREHSKHYAHIGQIPLEAKTQKGAALNEDAKRFWIDRIKQVEQKLELLRSK